VGETGTGLPATGSEGVLAEVLASSFDAIAVNELLEGRFVFVNDAFEKGTGFSRDEVIGRNSDEIGLSTEPGPEVTEASLAERVEVEVSEVERTGSPYLSEYRILGRDG